MVATGAIARQPTVPKDKATGREFGESRRRMKQTKQNGAGISSAEQQVRAGMFGTAPMAVTTHETKVART
jgi:hypothetical protein